VSLVAGEVLVRLTVGAPLRERLPIAEIRANPRRGWEMTPGQLHYTYQHPVRINSLGLRGPEPGPAVPGEMRLLALGDSLVYGQGVADDETIPAYLERFLNEQARPPRVWTVINGGVRAYNTRQELELLEELRERVRPSVVVLFWYVNDLESIDIARVHERIRTSGPVAFDTKTRVAGWPRARWRLTQVLRSSALLMLIHDVLRIVSVEPPSPEQTAAGLERLATELDRLRELGRTHGFDLLVAMIPDRNSLLGAHPSEDIERAVARMADERGIPHLRLHDALARLCAEEGHLPVLPFDGHYRPDANRAMADAVARWILARGSDPT
jgi:lysophospholipase L1-like esterase